MYEFDSTEGHDFVNPENLSQLEDQDKALLSEKYTHDVAAFRYDAIELLKRCTGMAGTMNWAMYELSPQPSSDLECVSDREVLIFTFMNSLSDLPILRILSNETFHVEGLTQVLTEDFILDQDGDTQFFVDAGEMKGGEFVTLHAPLFLVAEENRLQVHNLKVYPPAFQISLSGSLGVIPFGRYTHLHDKIDALAKGRELLVEIMSEEPVRQGSQ